MYRKLSIILILLMCGQAQAFWSSKVYYTSKRFESAARKLSAQKGLLPKMHTFDNKPEEISRTSRTSLVTQPSETIEKEKIRPESSNVRPYAFLGLGLFTSYGWYKGSQELERMRREGEQAHVLKEEKVKEILSKRPPFVNPDELKDKN